MKHIVIVIILLTAFVVHPLVAVNQDIIVNVAGQVSDLESGTPISNHLVKVQVLAAGTFQEFDLYTGSTGIFNLDSVATSIPGTVLVETLDCLGIPHILLDSISLSTTSFWFDFEICTDSLDCWNFFSYETLNQIDFTFNAEAYPYPAENYFWDFGDGTTGTGQSVFHSYNPFLQDTISVILTSYTNYPFGADTCWAISEQTFMVGVSNPGCENWFEYSSNDDLTFDFFGYSLPEAELYLWSFGDGQVATGENVTHTYEEGTSTLMNVTLETFAYSPATDTCYAISGQWIQVGNNIPCQADFIYFQDSTNSTTYSFIDQSIGAITSYLWEFGDGAFSSEQNPTYTYSIPGLYSVCLTVISDSLGFYCTDTFCDTLNVGYNLQAFYTAVLDTLSGTTQKFQFFDGSTGDPDSWFWDFGDGVYSYEQNPIHQYTSSGIYDVCLTVNRMIGGVNYEAIYCNDLDAPQYFDLGGQVYLDNIPMNNFNGDTTIVDGGMAYLYKQYENTLIPADTQFFDAYGYYWFSQLREGNYIVRVKLTDDSEHFGAYLPAYHTNAIQWQDANTISLSDGNSYTHEINLPQLTPLVQGVSTISGFVSYAGSFNPLMNSLQGIEVILLNQEFQPVAFTLTDEEAGFNFDGIPPGSYFLYSEASGLFTTTITIDIDESTTGIEDVQLQLYEQVLDVKNHLSEAVDVSQVYPNPVQGLASFDIKLTRGGVVRLDVFNLTGQKVIENKLILSSGLWTCGFNAALLPKGMYIITLSFPDEKNTVVRKFIK